MLIGAAIVPRMHLYAAFLGGPMSEGRMGEGHEVVMVVADDEKGARIRAKSKWTGKGRAHVDALQRIDRVDGFEIGLEPGAEGDRSELYGYN